MFGFKRRRRNRLRQAPIPNAWIETLERNVAYYALLPDDDRSELRGHVHVLVTEKNFEGCNGLEMNDEIRVTIAGHASVLLLHRDTDYFPYLQSILVYPDAFVAPVIEQEFGDDWIEGEDVHYGMSWHQGSIVLSWNHIRRMRRDREAGENLVLHEFAHQVDLEERITEGVPFLDEASEWHRAFAGEFQAFWEDVAKNRRTMIDDYGATDPAEFFAVVTETFFTRPIQFESRHPALYEIMRAVYKQDPARLA